MGALICIRPYNAGFGPRELNDFHYDTARTVKLPPFDPVAAESTKWEPDDADFNN